MKVWPWAWLLTLAALVHPTFSGLTKTRLVHTKYGQVQGFIRQLGSLMGRVEAFLGVPYASPPTEEGRFTPTNTPTPWDGVLDATRAGPVCPQLVPEPGDEKPQEVSLPRECAAFINKLRPLLSNQSEDCLTLNIYSPISVIAGSEVYPVLLYIHGESFSWGAGSLYDGSVLAAYARVVVVTINYRLGPLGFLNSYGGSTGGGVVSNFALLDQIAALNWVAENIREFNGDPSRVTVFGRDTGAACISYLMDSPIVPPGLFHRVVLVSGSSQCPWPHVESPLRSTLRLAVALGCPVPEHPGAAHPNTVACLRRANLATLMNAARTVHPPAFMSAWGPSEDGVVVAGRRATMTGGGGGRSKVEVMIGFSPWESWSWLGDTLLMEGVDELTFTRVARTWVRNTKRHHLREVLAAALQEYTDWSAVHAGPLTRRDLLLNMLADAGVVAPLHQTADHLSQTNKVYMFLCDITQGFNRKDGLSSHESHRSQQPGWELGLLWGAGLSSATMSPGAPPPPLPGPVLNQLSEGVITHLTNFAKTGDPNLPRESPSPGFASVAWPRYRPDTRNYFKIGVPPMVGSQYRAHQLALWSWLVPELEAAGRTYPPEHNSWELTDDPSLFYGPVMPPDPWYFLPPGATATAGEAENGLEHGGRAGAVVTSTTISTVMATVEPRGGPASSVRGRPTAPAVTTTLALAPTAFSSNNLSGQNDRGEYVRYSTALLITVGLGVSLLLLNALIFMLLFWRRPHQHPCQVQHPQGHVDAHLMAAGGMGHPTLGGPPDCVKASYEKLHLTSDQIQQLTRLERKGCGGGSGMIERETSFSVSNLLDHSTGATDDQGQFRAQSIHTLS
ncbi:unnamed protein product, partial [Meganyctiphanes norvegica]